MKENYLYIISSPDNLPLFIFIPFDLFDTTLLGLRFIRSPSCMFCILEEKHYQFRKSDDM